MGFTRSLENFPVREDGVCLCILNPLAEAVYSAMIPSEGETGSGT